MKLVLQKHEDKILPLFFALSFSNRSSSPLAVLISDEELNMDFF